MIPVLTREQSRALDQLAMSEGVPGLVLMENAGRGAAEHVAARALPTAKVVVVCGPGNNGGDGFVLARHLLLMGRGVSVFLAADPTSLRGDALENYHALLGQGQAVVSGTSDGFIDTLANEVASLSRADVTVDALFGTGLDRPIAGRHARVLDVLSHGAARRIALDLPSGMDANTGQRLGAALPASETLTFACPKPGLLTPAGVELAGPFVVVDIGIAPALIARLGYDAEVPEAEDVATWLTPRTACLHKHSAGHVLVVAGGAGTRGAALLAARGASRAGAGLVTLVSDEEGARALEPRVLEEMITTLDGADPLASLDVVLTRASSVVVGPGLGTTEDARRTAQHVGLRAPCPVVLDADALTAFAGRLAELRAAAGPRVLTPHAGELARLLGVTSKGIEADRFGSVKRAAEESGATVLLKGAHTLVATPGERTRVNATGSAVLATAGSGDVLAGVVAALSIGLAPAEAALAGACLHGLSGDAWAGAHGDRGMLAREIADGVPDALVGLATRRRVLPG